jgi:hypothetical protein
MIFKQLKKRVDDAAITRLRYSGVKDTAEIINTLERAINTAITVSHKPVW